MKKLSDDSDTVRVQLVTTEEWIARVDQWRRQQDDIPNRSDAIRRLVEAALKRQR